MGYYTDYDLDVLNEPFDGEEINHEAEIEKIAGYSGLFEGQLKWYDHDEHMREYSKKHKSLVFELKGEGEEAGDLWIKYFQNGKMQLCKARIEYDHFDVKRLG